MASWPMIPCAVKSCLTALIRSETKLHLTDQGLDFARTTPRRKSIVLSKTEAGRSSSGCSSLPAAGLENSLAVHLMSAFGFICFRWPRLSWRTSKGCSLRCLSRMLLSRSGHISMHVPFSKVEVSAEMFNNCKYWPSSAMFVFGIKI